MCERRPGAPTAAPRPPWAPRRQGCLGCPARPRRRGGPGGQPSRGFGISCESFWRAARRRAGASRRGGAALVSRAGGRPLSPKAVSVVRADAGALHPGGESGPCSPSIRERRCHNAPRARESLHALVGAGLKRAARRRRGTVARLTPAHGPFLCIAWRGQPLLAPMTDGPTTNQLGQPYSQRWAPAPAPTWPTGAVGARAVCK